jgi:hypothetical protein
MKENIEQKSGLHKPRKRIGRLKTIADLDKFMSLATKKVARGGEDANDYYKAAIVCSMHAKVKAAVTFEQRIATLEEQVKGKGRQ